MDHLYHGELSAITRGYRCFTYENRHGGLLAEHVPQAHCRATRHTHLESWGWSWAPEKADVWLMNRKTIEKPIQFGRSIKLNCTPWVKTFWTTCHMKSIWGTDNVIGYQPFLGHKVEQLIFNRVWCRWLDVDKKVQSQKNKSSRLQGLLLQAEKNNLNKTLQYLSWGLQLALDVGLPDHRV